MEYWTNVLNINFLLNVLLTNYYELLIRDVTLIHPNAGYFLGLKTYLFINFYPGVVQGLVVYKGCSPSDNSDTNSTKYLNTSYR
jgi:hypothetical protein